MSSRKFLDTRGYNIQVPGTSSGSYFGNARKYKKIWDARAARLRGLGIKQPFLIPAENPESGFFEKYPDQRELGGYTFEDFLGDPDAAMHIAKTIAKELSPWRHARTDLLQHAANESSGFVVKTVLVVPYNYGDVATLSPDVETTNRSVLAVTGPRLKSYHMSDMNKATSSDLYTNISGWAADVAEEIRVALANYSAGSGPRHGCAIVQQLGILPDEDEPHSSHQNGLVFDLKRMEAIILEPHMSTAEYDDFIPYAEIQASVASFLEELGFTMEMSPTSCPLQGNDEMCVLWSCYLAALYMTNPGVDHAVLAESVSYLDIYRMLYVAYLWVPMQRGNSAVRTASSVPGAKLHSHKNISRMYTQDAIDDGEKLDVRPDLMEKFRRQYSKHRTERRQYFYTDRAGLL